jgi:hypothetical protein
MFYLSWSASHDSWPHFHMHVVSFQKSLLQIYRVSCRIWCLLSAPVSRPCWNRKCEGTRGDKHLCCATPNVNTATPLGILSGDFPCSQVQHTHTRTAIGWQSVELVSKLFDTPSYIQNWITKTQAHTKRKTSYRKIFWKVMFFHLPVNTFCFIICCRQYRNSTNSHIQHTNSWPSCAEYNPHEEAVNTYWNRVTQ